MLVTTNGTAVLVRRLGRSGANSKPVVDDAGRAEAGEGSAPSQRLPPRRSGAIHRWPLQRGRWSSTAG